MRKENKLTNHTTLEVRKDIHKQLKAIAKTNRYNLKDLIQKILYEYIQEYNKNNDFLF